MMGTLLIADDFGTHPNVIPLGRATIGRWVLLASRVASAGNVSGLIPEPFIDDVPLVSLREMESAGLVTSLAEPDVYLGHGKHNVRPLWRIPPDDQRAPISDWLRSKVYERDGHQCQHCGATAPLSLDHIYPWSLGGGDTIENLQTLCRSCNSRKGARV